MITLKNIVLRRGANILLNDINWTIYHKQRIGLIGANGSGKTTLFAFLCQHFAADSGSIDIPKHLKIAQMAQEIETLDRTSLDFVLDGDSELRQLEAMLDDAMDANDGEKIAAIHEKLAIIDAYTAPARAGQLLAGLGFSFQEQQKTVREFSGGWRVRLNLAKALMMRSDVLLLDEPTNHLDLDAVLWLEQWLKKYTGTLLLISHDRDFLDETVDHIAHIARQQLTLYSGNYSSFETQRAAELLVQQATYEKQQTKIAHMQSFVDRFRAKASKAKQAQSRMKAIERMDKVLAVQAESPFEFEFRLPKSAPNPLLKLEYADAGYGDRIVLKNINLSLAPKERIALLGPNGAGKSTFIKLLAGELKPLSGEIYHASGLKIGYFAQHQVDELDLEASALLHMQRLSNKSDTELRKFLGNFAFTGDKVLAPLKTFSGGEKSRLALAIIVWQEPNLLLLDEPTNHLDLEMRNALSIALQEYEGAMLLVSHDRFLVKTTTDQLYLAANHQIEKFEGDLNEYQQWLIQFRKKQLENENPNKKSAAKQKIKIQEDTKAKEKRKSVLQTIKQLEDELTKYQKKLNQIETYLLDETIYTPQNKTQLQTHLHQQDQLKKEIMVLEEKWLNACEARDELDNV